MKMFLVVVEMSETEVPAENVKSEGIAVRAWWGVKLVRRCILILLSVSLNWLVHSVVVGSFRALHALRSQAHL